MIERRTPSVHVSALCLALWLGAGVLVPAQEAPVRKAEAPKAVSKPILDQLDPGRGPEVNPLKLSGEYAIGKGTRQGRLSIRAKIAPDWHVGSTTQTPGGPLPTQIFVEPSRDYQITRPFVPDRRPLVKQESFPVLSELHEGEVIWTAPFQIAEGVDPTRLNVDTKFSGGVCKDHVGCIPILRQPVQVTLAGEYDPPDVGTYQARGMHVKISGQVAPRVAKPGEIVKLSITAEPMSDYHIYAYAERDPEQVSKPTLIAWKAKPGWATSPVTTSAKPIEHATGIKEQPTEYYHEQPVTWTVELQVPGEATPGGYELRGLLGFQTCTSKGCDPPSGAEFRVVVEVAKLRADPGAEPLEFVRASYSEAAKLAAAPPAPSSAPDAARTTGAGVNKEGSLLATLVLAFLGGAVLNLMPCVFPVLGIKILGFVKQAGNDQRKVVLHGVAFTAGVMVSFWILAALLIALRAGGKQLGWGFQLQEPAFVFGMLVFLLLFALNLSGVFEFGLAATRVGSSVPTNEGLTRSFVTGALATLVATPCSAPFLAPALGVALLLPAAQSLLVFSMIGLGLALPYLLLSMFPAAVKLLPRPGEWMETFKQFMAFPLYATVGFLLWVLAGQVANNDYALLWIVLSLTLVAMAAWCYGRFALADGHPVRQTLGKVFGAALLVGGIWLGWPNSSASQEGYQVVWQKWSPAAVETLREQGKIIYVDFTARWCVTCQTNKVAVFSSQDVLDAFSKHDVALLKADWTSHDETITQELNRWNRPLVPLNLIYLPNQPDPVVLPPLLTAGTVLDALKPALNRESRSIVVADQTENTRR